MVCLVFELSILDRLRLVGSPWREFFAFYTFDLTKTSRCKISCRIIKLIHDFCIEYFFVSFKVCNGLAQMLSDILPTNICQFMDWSINDISKSSEHQEVLGCLGSLYKDQTIIITLANFFQSRCRKGTWASTLDIACLSYADIGIFLGNQTSCVNLDCFRSIFQSTQTWCRKFLLNLTKLFLHEIVHSPFITDDSRKHGNLFTQFCFFFLQDNHVCIGQTVKL